MLYVCPTPIGNLEDITLRVLRVLKEADLILAEDTRRTRRLLRHFKIKKPLTSFHDHNEKEKSRMVISLLEQGQKIALVSDAGMPGISDPGVFLIKKVIEQGLPLEVLPGANAALVGYLQSGFLGDAFLYYGFLPRRSRERLRVLESLQDWPYPLIFYEAPHRLAAMLADVLAVLGNRAISVSRELTKQFEETRRGTVDELLAFYRENTPRGEFVVTVSGREEEAGGIEESDISQLLQKLLSGGLSTKDAVEQVSKKYRLPRNQVYRIALEVKPED
ncbi:MAG: 16S rRNA (cytidine(1402)-2'-O)-methyltransferase [Firmicutes bacterium]|nr:16S rRNA (cytidine(1402)-2'-O)-methyltransferase [Bacillota bacterium]